MREALVEKNSMEKNSMEKNSMEKKNGAALPYERVFVTVQMAQHWLAHANLRNRALGEKHAQRLADEIIRGRWKENGDAIRFDTNGVLLDGQHRLRAVVIAGVGIWALVVRGLSPDVLGSIDGLIKVRLAGDVASLHGVANARTHAAIAAVVDAYFTGCVRYDARGWPALSGTEVLSVINLYPGIDASVPVAARVHSLANPSVAAAAHYLFALVNRPRADRFLDDVITGAGLAEFDPALSLRNALLKARASKRTSIPKTHVLGLFIKAWNARETGRSLRYSRVRLEGAKPEEFPQVAGLAGPPRSGAR